MTSKKRYFKLLILILILCTGSIWDNFHCGDKRIIVQIIRDFEEASKTANREELERILTEDFVLLAYDARDGYYNIFSSREKYISDCEKNPMLEGADFYDFDIDINSGEVICNYNEGEPGYNGAYYGAYSELWFIKNNDWKIYKWLRI